MDHIFSMDKIQTIPRKGKINANDEMKMSDQASGSIWSENKSAQSEFVLKEKIKKAAFTQLNQK